MSIDPISNAESGASVRAKLNAVIEAANNGIGNWDHVGEGVPDSGLGDNGDTYFDTGSSTGDWYFKADGSWTKQGQLEGPEGPAGAAATIAVGTVTTGSPGTDVIVTNDGTSSAAVFDFTIPRGDVGPANAAPWVATIAGDGETTESKDAATYVVDEDDLDDVIAAALAGGAREFFLIGSCEAAAAVDIDTADEVRISGLVGAVIDGPLTVSVAGGPVILDERLAVTGTITDTHDRINAGKTMPATEGEIGSLFGEYAHTVLTDDMELMPGAGPYIVDLDLGSDELTLGTGLDWATGEAPDGDLLRLLVDRAHGGQWLAFVLSAQESV